ncbi:hypothetical protein GTW20_19755 [Nocardiopsis alba]|uniref:ParB-like nuclease domain protein n=1 Tax=Nocardiopsis alba TaxID=53437 RepID=A0A7K2IWS1_9ACTN|nr:hypothetical protein [Nocardiopsis alba]MYR34420.1 hypothetical protein [Nocardiopsis alba]
MHAAVEKITPAVATSWLKHLNAKNRPMRMQTVDFYARQLKRGEWQLTHQGIAFDEDGNLLDGQHRLEAIRKSGISAQCMVIRGAPRESFKVLDTGRKRNGRDVLTLDGEKNTLHLAAALRGLHLYQSSPESPWFGQTSMVSNNQLMDTLEANPGIREAIIKGANIHRAIRMTTTAATIGWHVTTTARPDIDQTPWYKALIYGADLRHGDPRLALRNAMVALTSPRVTRKREDTRGQLFFYIKAWNAWAEGREIQVLRRTKSEKMPRPTMKNFRPKAPKKDTPIEGL